MLGAVPQIVALLLGIAASSVLMAAAGFDPITVFSMLFQGALATQYGQSYAITYTGTYLLSAIAFLIPAKAGIFNVGAQGQIFMGGITAALVAIFVPLPPVVWPLVCVIAGCLAGGLWGLIPGALEAYRNASAIVTTIMMNLIAQPLSSYLLLNVIVLKQKNVAIYTTATFDPAATLPGIPYFSTSIMIFVSLAVAAGTAYFLFRTTLGYNIRASGLGAAPAEAKGINPRTMKVLALVIGGLVAGLAGAGDVLGPGHACFLKACYADGFAGGYFGGEGFAGIAVALVAANSPIGAIFSAAFFAILAAGTAVGTSGPQLYLAEAMQGLIIIFMAMPYVSTQVMKFRRKRART
jgi:general nucleoside transport system permease protein